MRSEYMKEYYQRNKERLNKYRNEWAKNNREKQNEYKRRYRQKQKGDKNGQNTVKDNTKPTGTGNAIPVGSDRSED